jgi:bacterioferritin-associated ferredoxin
MIVCVCNCVTDRQIREAAGRGVASLDELSDQLKVATCCGRCRDCAQRMLDDAIAQQWPATGALVCA